MIQRNLAKQQILLTLNGDRFLDNLPRSPYCSNDLGFGIRPRTKVNALNHRYIQHNPPSMQYWLTFDIDHERIMPWEDTNLPAPNFVVRNLHNRKMHIHYAVQGVCTSEAARIKPMQYAASVQMAITEALGADSGYTGLITKNPYSNEWAVMELHQHEFSLGELAYNFSHNLETWRSHLRSSFK